VSTFKIGDRVRVAQYCENRPCETGDVVREITSGYSVRFDDGEQFGYFTASLTLADERAVLVAARDLAKGDFDVKAGLSERAQANYQKHLAALTAYDEAHRTPTFAEKVAGLGIGAVLQSEVIPQTRWVKVLPCVWQSGQSGETRSDSDFTHAWRILSEGVRVPAADEGVTDE